MCVHIEVVESCVESAGLVYSPARPSWVIAVLREAEEVMSALQLTRATVMMQCCSRCPGNRIKYLKHFIPE